MGLTTALQIKREWNGVSVDIISEGTAQESTSHGAAGLWEPYQIEGSADEDINRWGNTTYEHFKALFLSPLCGSAGVQFLSFHQLYTQGFVAAHGGAVGAPAWAPIVHNYTMHAPGDALQLYAGCGDIAQMHEFGTFVVDQPRYLRFLQAQLQDSGGAARMPVRVDSFGDVVDRGYKCIFNCTGLGSRELAADGDMVPVRGQVQRMRAPWLKHAVMLDKEFYILPNVDSVVVGGTQQRGDERVDVDATDTEKIWAATVRMCPSIEGAEPITEWAGVRPVRSSGVRLECEFMEGPVGNKVPLVHNYGHGGSGVTLHWGCVQQALQTARDSLQLVGVDIGSIAPARTAAGLASSIG